MTFLKPSGLSIDTSPVSMARANRKKRLQIIGNQDMGKSHSSSARPEKSDMISELNYTRLLCEANIYRRKKNYTKAIEIFRKLLELKPGTLSVYIYLAKALESIGQFSEAYKVYRQAISSNPFNPRAYDVLIEFCMTTSLYEEALDLINQAVKLENSAHLQILRCKILYELKDYQSTVTFASKIIAQFPGRFTAFRLMYVECILKLCDKNSEHSNATSLENTLRGVSDILKDVISHAPNNVRAKYMLSIVYMKLNEYSKAKKILEFALDIDPLNEDVANALADVIDQIEWSNSTS